MRNQFTLKIYPDPVLRKTATPVNDVTETVRTLINGMARIMYKGEGVGLAAPQVGKLKRVIIADIGEGLISMVNPEIVEGFGEDYLEEGCLSIPDVRVNVKRQQSVFVRFLDRNGREAEQEFAGLTARVIQHEVDHLNGVLIIDHGPIQVEALPKERTQAIVDVTFT